MNHYCITGRYTALSTEVPVNEKATVSLYTSQWKKKKPKMAFSNRDLTVPLISKGFAALSFALSKKSVKAAIHPVENGMKVIDLGMPWGKCCVFRIRSPFGWDSIYGFLEASPLADAAVTVTCAGNTATQKHLSIRVVVLQTLIQANRCTAHSGKS